MGQSRREQEETWGAHSKTDNENRIRSHFNAGVLNP